MVLVDTSVWIAHFRQTSHTLTALLNTDQVVCHPFIVAEIACGTPPHRARTLAGLGHLQQLEMATIPETIAAIETQQWFGRGCGWVDLSLLAAVLAHPDVQLWTLDKRQAALAAELGIAFRPPLDS
jgi:predicted nucleic acid-binding protein